MLLEDIDPDSWLVRQVYAYFGLAIYAAQVLEHGIVNLAVWTGVRDGSIRAAEDTDADYESLFRLTMGQLNRTLKSRRPDYSQIEDDLGRALALRNFLAHHYFRERSAAFMTEEGKDQMITELQAARDFLREVDGRLDALTAQILSLLGVDKHLAEAERAALQQGFGPALPGLTG
jgi:hypothetical protein